MTRPYNFGAGPATLPESILLEAQAEMLDWQGTGMSVMEIGHRTPQFKSLMQESEALLRELLIIPDNYHVLFLGEAARMLFSMVPMNFLNVQQKAAYWTTGLWSEIAYAEAQKYNQNACKQVINQTEFSALSDLAYFYYTPNETVDGVYYAKPTLPANIPIVADMTSCLLTQPINVDEYDLIFAGAQKNIANAGMTVVIVRDAWIKSITAINLPTMLDFRTHVEHQSLYATPPMFNCYIANKMFTWIKQQGGVEALYKINCEKAKRLYEYIDQSSFYSCTINNNQRSIINICFTLQDVSLEPLFLELATQNNLLALKGHRTKSGLRASLYNAMPLEGVDALIKFMHDFRTQYA